MPFFWRILNIFWPFWIFVCKTRNNQMVTNEKHLNLFLVVIVSFRRNSEELVLLAPLLKPGSKKKQLSGHSPENKHQTVPATESYWVHVIHVLNWRFHLLKRDMPTTIIILHSRAPVCALSHWLFKGTPDPLSFMSAAHGGTASPGVSTWRPYGSMWAGFTISICSSPASTCWSRGRSPSSTPSCLPWWPWSFTLLTCLCPFTCGWRWSSSRGWREGIQRALWLSWAECGHTSALKKLISFSAQERTSQATKILDRYISSVHSSTSRPSDLFWLFAPVQMKRCWIFFSTYYVIL